MINTAYQVITLAMIASIFLVFTAAKLNERSEHNAKLARERERRNINGQYLRKVRVTDFNNGLTGYIYL